VIFGIAIAAAATGAAGAPVSERTGVPAGAACATYSAGGSVVPTSAAYPTTTDRSGNSYPISSGLASRATDATGASCAAGTAGTSRTGIAAGTSPTTSWIRLVAGRTGTAISRLARISTGPAGTASPVHGDIRGQVDKAVAAGVTAIPARTTGAAVAAVAAGLAGTVRSPGGAGASGHAVAAITSHTTAAADPTRATRTEYPRAGTARAAVTAGTAGGATRAGLTGCRRIGGVCAGPALTTGPAVATVTHYRQRARTAACATVSAGRAIPHGYCAGSPAAAITDKKAPVSAVSTVPAVNPRTSGAAIAEPPGRATVAPVVTVAAVTDQPTVAAIASRGPRASFGRPGVPIAEQNSRVRMFRCTVTPQPQITCAKSGRGTYRRRRRRPRRRGRGARRSSRGFNGIACRHRICNLRSLRATYITPNQAQSRPQQRRRARQVTASATDMFTETQPLQQFCAQTSDRTGRLRGGRNWQGRHGRSRLARA
jgi:hypothetical protein